MAVGCVGFSVREFDLAAPIAVLVALALQDRRHLAAYGILGASLVVAAVRRRLRVDVATGRAPSTTHSAGRRLGAPRARSAAISRWLCSSRPSCRRRPDGPGRPARPEGWPRRRGRYWSSEPCSWAPATLIFSGNYLTPQGMSTTATLPGFRPVLFPTPLWLLLELIGLGAGTRARVHRRQCRRRPDFFPSLAGGRVSERSVITIFTWLGCAGLVIYGLFVQGAIFDRYVWPLVFGTAVLLAAKGRALRARLQFMLPERPAGPA